jgi:hypothetical protein
VIVTLMSYGGAMGPAADQPPFRGKRGRRVKRRKR